MKKSYTAPTSVGVDEKSSSSHDGKSSIEGKPDDASLDDLGDSQKNDFYQPVQKLSRANMKKHDLELAQLPTSKPQDSLSTYAVTHPNYTEEPKRKRRKRLKLPVISLALDRTFPLPNPKQIELYTQGEDEVRLDPRPYKSSTPSSTETCSCTDSSQ